MSTPQRRARSGPVVAAVSKGICLCLLSLFSSGCAVTGWEVSSDIPVIAHTAAKAQARLAEGIPPRCQEGELLHVGAEASMKGSGPGLPRTRYSYGSHCSKADLEP